MKYGDVLRDAKEREVPQDLIVMFICRKLPSFGEFLILDGHERGFEPGAIQTWKDDDWEPVK